MEQTDELGAAPQAGFSHLSGRDHRAKIAAEERVDELVVPKHDPVRRELDKANSTFALFTPSAEARQHLAAEVADLGVDDVRAGVRQVDADGRPRRHGFPADDPG